MNNINNGRTVARWALCLMLACAARPGAAGTAESTGTVAALALEQAKPLPPKGLALYLGAPDGKALAELAAGCGLQVQGLTGDRERADRLRAQLPSFKEAERLSAVWRRTAHLPYLDGLADLIVVEGWGGGDAQGLALADVVRVLCPGGVAVLGSDSGSNAAALQAEAAKLPHVKAEALARKGAWIRLARQFDPALGDWCGGTAQGAVAVSSDRVVEPTTEVRWVNDPKYGATLDGYSNTGSYSIGCFAAGRNFFMEAEYTRPGVTQYFLGARNAFNGCVQWRVPVPDRSAMVAADEQRVYVSEGKELVARDAASGAALLNFGPGSRGRYTHHTRDKLIVCVYTPLTVYEKATGKKIWSRGNYGQVHAPAYRGNTMYLAGPGVEALNIDDGKTLWKAAPPELAAPGGAYRGVWQKGGTLYVLFDYAEGEQKFTRLLALNADDGAVRWSDTRPRHGAHILPFDDQVWLVQEAKADKQVNYVFTALDAGTGKELKTVTAGKGTGCWGPRASDGYILWSRANFLNRKTFETREFFGVRSSCSVGQIPAFGLVHYGPHTCNCYIALRGIVALGGPSRLPKGTAQPQVFKGTDAPAGAPASATDWPVYRGGGTRANSRAADLPAQLKLKWSALAGGSELPQATGANGLVFIAAAEQHRVAALDLETGKEKWSFTAEGRVSVAPTYHEGLCLFGDHAGWAYALDAATGKPVWQAQGAPEQKYMSAFGQFESAWPVKSGVLVLNGVAYFVAGRIGTLEGGVYVLGVDAKTGAVLATQNFNDADKWERYPKTADLLQCDGNSLIGWGKGLATAAPAPKPAGKPAPPSKMLKFGSTWQGPNALLDMLKPMNPAGTYMKTAPSDGKVSGEFISFDAQRTVATGRRITGKKDAEDGRGVVTLSSGGAAKWSQTGTGLHMQGVVLAGGRVYAAGLHEFHDPKEPAGLCVLAAEDGKILQQLKLDAAPANDGLSAVGNKLLVTTVDGRVLCFGE